MRTQPNLHALTGLYVILDPSVNPEQSLSVVLSDAAAAGAHLFQYRNKSASMKEAYAEALTLRTLAADAGVLFFINDRCDLALAVDADGVHLGQNDLPLAYARKVMGPDKLIGLSTHTVAQVREAEHVKPDYLGFGPIFQPVSKQDHDPVVGITGLRTVRPLTSLPIFAIGGIHSEHVAALLNAGANGVAVMSAVLKAHDVRKAVQELLTELKKSASPAV